MNIEIPKKKRLNARLEAVLFETDTPDVALLSRKQGKGVQHYIACSIPDVDGFVDFYLVVFVGRSYLLKYLNDQCDLRFLFTYAGGKRFYKSDALIPSEKGQTVLEEYTDNITEELLPEGRFFASSHTTTYGLLDVATGEQRLLIDGNWDMQEFGAFYQKFADLYSYEQAIHYLLGGAASKIKGVVAAFRTKPFRGGSSYMGFFDDLFGLIPFGERPALDGIVYHSPGHVDLRGKDDILDGVKESVEAFLANTDKIQAAHDDLKGFMSKSGLLKITGKSPPPGPDVLVRLRELSTAFYAVMPISGKERLLELTDGSIVVYSKVGLALFRRLRATALFFAQGRLSFDENS